jgi:hypothetical protein
MITWAADRHNPEQHPMKKLLPTLLTAAALTLAPAVFAADQAKSPAPKEKETKATCEACKDAAKGDTGSKEKKVVLTGSLLPQRVTKVGRITDSVQPVSVYSREDLASTGEHDLASALRKLSPALQ